MNKKNISIKIRNKRSIILVLNYWCFGSSDLNPWVPAQLLSRVQLSCDPMDCSPPGSSVHGISQARIQAMVAISSFKGSSQPKDRTHASCISCTAGRFFTTEPSGKPPAKYIFIFRYNLRSSEVGKPSSLKSHCFSLIQLSPETSQPKRYTFFP